MKADHYLLGIQGVLLVISALPHSEARGGAVQLTQGRIAVWDTGRASANRMSSRDLAEKAGWERTPRNQKASSFRGDAVMANGRVLAVLRKRSPAVGGHSISVLVSGNWSSFFTIQRRIVERLELNSRMAVSGFKI